MDKHKQKATANYTYELYELQKELTTAINVILLLDDDLTTEKGLSLLHEYVAIFSRNHKFYYG